MQTLLREDEAFAERLDRARSLLRRPRRADPASPALAAACLFAICALSCAVGAMTGPPFSVERAQPTAAKAS